MDFQPQDRIVLRQPQIHGNSSVLLDGQVLSIEGSNARVSLDGEIVPRTVPLGALSKADAMYGDEPTGRPNENVVFNAIRR